MTAGAVTAIPVHGIGEVGPGTDLAGLIAAVADLRDGDVVVVASKVVAKAEGMVAHPIPGEDHAVARRRLAMHDEVLVDSPQVVVVRTRHGFVCANAGIDASNVGSGGDLLLLPADPDASAAALRTALAPVAAVAVVISDTFGRPWREGQTDVALGVSGMAALRDERGRADRDGRILNVTLVAVADQIAGAADLVRDKGAGIPVVVVRGLGHLLGEHDGGGRTLVRPPEADMFAHGRGWLARRLATGEGATVRSGRPAGWEWDLVARAAGAVVVEDGLRCPDGLAAGRAEACLLDLGFGVALSPGGQGWLVDVTTPDGG